MADEKPVTDSQQTDDAQPSDQDSAAPKDAGVEDTPTSQEPEAEGATADTASHDQSDLLTPEERKTLNAIKDPDERIKGFERAYIKKTQQLADQRKELGSWLDVKKAYEEDKVGTLIDIARRHGLEVRDPNASTEDKTADLAGEITELVKQEFGPEYEDLADKAAAAILKASQRIVAETTKPLQARQEEIIADTAKRESGELLEAFKKDHPDLDDYIGRMNELALQFQPGVDPKTGKPAVTEREWLSYLYNLAKPRDVQVAEAAKKAVAKMAKSAQAASKDAPGVSGDKVSTRTDGPISMDRAYELAKQGVVVGR